MDYAGLIDTKVELPPAAPAAATVFRGGPFTCPDDGQPRAVEHEMEALAGRDQSQTARQMLTAPGERRIVGDGEVEAHHPEQGVQESFGLAQREMVEESQDQGGLDGELRIPPLPTPPAASGGASRQRSPPRTTTPSHRRVERGPGYRLASSQRDTSSYTWDEPSTSSLQCDSCGGSREVRATPPHPQRVFMQQRRLSPVAEPVVMTTRGPEGFLGALRGSTSSTIIRKCRCPVLAVPRA